MRCPDCDYELRPGSRECPRCEFRRAASGPEPAAAEAPVPAPAPARPAPVKWAAALLAGLLLVGGGAGLLRRPKTPEAQVRAVFAAAEAPCRHGDQDVCEGSVKKIRDLNDQPDASLLLADLRVATYLHTLSGGDRLSARWQNDQITQPELTAMGNAAYRKGLGVYRSLWISADIKRNDVAVPELIFGGARLPNSSQ